VSCHPAQPAQHVRYMGPEDTAVAVALIHDHVLQPPEEAIPPVMARQQHVVQHVGRGEQVAGVRPGPGPLGSRGVPVQDRGAHAGQAKGSHHAQLVGGERPGGREVKAGSARQHAGQRRKQVADGLSDAVPVEMITCRPEWAWSAAAA